MARVDGDGPALVPVMRGGRLVRARVRIRVRVRVRVLTLTLTSDARWPPVPFGASAVLAARFSIYLSIYLPG